MLHKGSKVWRRIDAQKEKKKQQSSPANLQSHKSILYNAAIWANTHNISHPTLPLPSPPPCPSTQLSPPPLPLRSNPYSNISCIILCIFFCFASFFLLYVDMTASARTHSALLIIASLLFPCHDRARIIPVWKAGARGPFRLIVQAGSTRTQRSHECLCVLRCPISVPLITCFHLVKLTVCVEAAARTSDNYWILPGGFLGTCKQGRGV